MLMRTFLLSRSQADQVLEASSCYLQGQMTHGVISHMSAAKCPFSQKASKDLSSYYYKTSALKYMRCEEENFTSLYSWIWLCSNMENTLEDPPSPCCCLLLAFLGACEMMRGEMHFKHNINQTDFTIRRSGHG